LRFLRFPFALPAVNGRGSCHGKARKNERKGGSAVEALRVMAAMDHMMASGPVRLKGKHDG
jgi:hypothetical protein